MAADSTTMDIGDVVRLVRLFHDEAGDPADPDTVVFTVRAPDGEVTEVDDHAVTDADELAACEAILGVTLVDGTGLYTATFEPDLHGTWRYRIEGIGGVTSAEEGSFQVRRRRVALVEGS